MLNALNELHDDQREVALADIAQRLLPSAGDLPPAPDHLQAALNELSQIAKVGKKDSAEARRVKMLAVITAMMMTYGLPPSQEEPTLQRLGNMGRLQPQQYQLVFTDGYDQDEAKLGIPKTSIRDTVYNPDAFEHLVDGTPEDPNVNRISLFIRFFQRGDDSHCLLVQTFRKGGTLTFDLAWIVFTEELELHSTNPTDVLTAFLGVHGIDVIVGNEAPTRLVINRDVPNVPDGNTRLIHVPGVVRYDGSIMPHKISMIVHPLEGVTSIVRAYCVACDGYLRSLTDHGFAVRG